MISALTWVPPGACRAHPIRHDVRPDGRTTMSVDERGENRERIDALMDDGEENEVGGDGSDGYEDEMKNLRMDEYDEDEEEGGLNLGHKVAEVEPEPGCESECDEDNDHSNSDNEKEETLGGAAAETSMNFSEMSGAMINAIEQDDDFLGEEEEDDIEIKGSDAVLLVASTEEDEFSFIEMNIYDQESGALYTHHDIILPEIPLCLEWVGAPPCAADIVGTAINEATTTSGSFVAVGTFQPGIELWNLDVVDPLEPTAILGGPSSQTGGSAVVSKQKKKKKNKNKRIEPTGHSDSVLCLKWNTFQKQALASASADTTVKIWDITKQECVETLPYHTDKVLGCTWHPLEASVLATAALDRQVVIADVRAPPRSLSEATTTFTISADPEDIQWDPQNGYNLVVGTEDGRILCYDVRHSGPGVSPLYAFQAHENDGIGGMSFSPHKLGLLATCSPDQTVKLWDVYNMTKHGKSPPRCISCKDMSVGRLFGVQWFVGTPYLLATGGSGGQVALWHTDDVLEGVSMGCDLGDDGSYLQPDLNGGEESRNILEEQIHTNAETKFAVEGENLTSVKKKKKKKKEP